MHSILLIGAGNIGRRHLQGLLGAKNKLDIHIVEPGKQQHLLIDAAIHEAGGLHHHQVNIYSSLNEITTTSFVITIVATNADIRKKVVVDFLSKKTTTYLILEKVLFQRLDDYKEIGKLLYEKKIKTYVNCTRRYFPHYRLIKKAVAGHTFMEMEVSGSNWGLACNAIHLLDLFNYFNNHTAYQFTGEKIDDVIQPAKRVGFIEMTGTLSTSQTDLFQFSATSHNNSGEPLTIRFKTNEAEFIINETAGHISSRAVLENETNQHFNNLQIDYEALPLSRSANLFADDLLDTGNCLLTDYFVSAQLHTALLNSYLAKLHSLNYKFENDACPIT